MLDGDVFFCDNLHQELGQIGGNAACVSVLPAKYFLTLTIKLNHYMKKYITLAALLAAGTACANAETLTLTSPTDGSLTSGNAAIAWSEADVTGALQSWEVTFTVDSQRSALAEVDLATICSKWYFAFNTNGSIEFYLKDDSQSSSSSAGWVTVDSVAITVSFVGDYNVDGVFQNKGVLSATIGENTHTLTVADNLAITSSGSDGSGFRLWTNNKNEHYSNISVTKLDNHIVPEPSAFGLLAGVGALALVASRRRRK